jgi:hypothetical protein
MTKYHYTMLTATVSRSVEGQSKMASFFAHEKC